MKVKRFFQCGIGVCGDTKSASNKRIIPQVCPGALLWVGAGIYLLISKLF